MRESTLTHDELTRKLDYNPETGEFRWKVRSAHRIQVGMIAGCLNVRGYWQIAINGKRHLAHRLAWFYVHGRWPSDQIDHIDQNPLNNVIANLREATCKQNQENQSRPHSHNKLGIQGVSKKKSRYSAQVVHNGKQIHIGYFDTPEEASAAYWKAKEELHEFCPQL